LRFFIAGIMQGSRRGKGICDQSYRGRIRAAIRAHFPDAEIIDPLELHPESPSYGAEKARRTFFEMIDEVLRADFLVAYLPEASMGTAVEMWQAYKAGIPIVTISPMASNWVVRFLSKRVLPDLDSFEEFVSEGGFEGI